MYSVVNVGNGFIVKKNNQPLTLEGVGLLLFKTYEEAARYITSIRQAQWNISMGVPE